MGRRTPAGEGLPLGIYPAWQADLIDHARASSDRIGTACILMTGSLFAMMAIRVVVAWIGGRL